MGQIVLGKINDDPIGKEMEVAEKFVEINVNSAEPAKFECSAECQNWGQGWQLFGPMGI